MSVKFITKPDARGRRVIGIGLTRDDLENLRASRVGERIEFDGAEITVDGYVFWIFYGADDAALRRACIVLNAEIGKEAEAASWPTCQRCGLALRHGEPWEITHRHELAAPDAWHGSPEWCIRALKAALAGARAKE